MLVSRILTLAVLSLLAFGDFIHREGIKLKQNGRNYFYAGCNSYDIFTKSHEDIDKRMSEMQSDLVRVVRISAFSHSDWHGFETKKGYYVEEQFALFDYVMVSARKHNISVIIILEDYWGSYGGIVTRLKWENLPGQTHKQKAVFYKNSGCKEGYKNFLKHFVTRVNTITGKPYIEDEYIFSWELMNEPRYMESGEDSTGYTLRKWSEEMAKYIKSLDPNHMVSMGLEGHGKKYNYGGNEGNPFVYIHQNPYIDFTTGHLYPDEDWANLSPEEAMKVISAWIYDSHKVIGKPFILEEYNSRKKQDEYWNKMLSAMAILGGSGDNFWNYEPCRENCDFCICHEHPLIAKVFIPHAKIMNNKQ